MISINKVQIIGRLGQDPEQRFMQSGNEVCNLSVATSESWKDKNTGEKKEATEWHRVNVFGKLAEVCNQYLRKGQLVYIEGSIHTRKWTDKEGVDRYSTEIRAKEMRMLTPKSEGGDRGSSRGSERAEPRQSQRAEPKQEATRQAPPDFDDLDSDIPF